MAHFRTDRPPLHDAQPLAADPVIEVFKKDVDRTLNRAQLRRSADERVQAMIGGLRFAEALRHAARGAPKR